LLEQSKKDPTTQESLVKREFAATCVAVDILSTLILYHNFVEWGGYSSPDGKIVGAFACIYVVNFWLTTRSSFRVYSGRLLFLDLASLFILANLPHTIQAIQHPWGYSPLFWLGLSVVELLNLDWNSALKRESPAERVKSHYTRWWILTAIAAVMGVGVFTYQLLGNDLLVGRIAAGLVIVFHIWMILRWNWDRYKSLKNQGGSFLDV
jgi:hypothetical protein